MVYNPTYPSGWEDLPSTNTPITAASLDNIDAGLVDTNSTIAAAQSTADQGVADAAAAQSTADQASTDAATAQSTADQAVTDAATAQTTADGKVDAPAVAPEPWQILQPDGSLEMTWQDFNAWSVGLGWLQGGEDQIAYADAVNVTERPADVPTTHPVRIYGGLSTDPSPFTSWMLPIDYWDTDD